MILFTLVYCLINVNQKLVHVLHKVLKHKEDIPHLNQQIVLQAQDYKPVSSQHYVCNRIVKKKKKCTKKKCTCINH